MAEKEKPFGVASSPFEKEGPIDISKTSGVSGKSAPMDMPGYGGQMPASPFDTLEARGPPVGETPYHETIKDEVGHPEGAEPPDELPFELPPPTGAEPPEPAPYESAPPEPAPYESAPPPFEAAPTPSIMPPSPYAEPPSPYGETAPSPFESPAPGQEPAPPLPAEMPPTPYEYAEGSPALEAKAGAPAAGAPHPSTYSPSDIQMLARSVADGVREELSSKIDALSEDVDELKTLETQLAGITASLQKIETRFEQLQSTDIEEVKSSVASIKALLSKALPALITEIRAFKTKS